MRSFVVPASVLGGCLVLAATIVSHAGPLNPPAGAVSSTYKTLTEVEPRIAVSAANTPGDAGSSFIISQTGSYYLTGNITGVSGRNGIRITAPSVTLDLSGFSVTGVSGAQSGVSIANTASRATIRNGAISNWPQDGIDGGFNTLGRYERLVVTGNGSGAGGRFGIRAGGTSIVTQCDASSNTGGGFGANDSCTISECVAVGNSGVGFSFGAGCVVRGCTAQNNTSMGYSGANFNTVEGCTAVGTLATSSRGFSLGSNCRLKDCTAGNYASGIVVLTRCVVTGCAASGGTGVGITIGDDGEVTHCSANGNGGIGISAAAGVLVAHCTANGNAGDNIYVFHRCNVVDCVANGSTGGNGINLVFVTNMATNCTANGNFLNGIYAQQRSKVVASTCKDNQQNGIRINVVGAAMENFCNGNLVCGIVCDGGGFVDIRNNTCSENGNATTLGAGIRVTTNQCRIDGNYMISNYRNLDVPGGGNLIAHNSVAFAGAGGNFSVAANNSYGPFVNVFTVGDMTGVVNSNHPMANYQH